MKKKKEKPEDFIGWKSEDGKLEVVGIAERFTSHTRYYVTCTECSKDPELFPDGYFISTRGSLRNGTKPCGCSERHIWKASQYLLLARREAKGKYIVHGFVEDFKGNETKVKCECSTDGYTWEVKLYHLISSKSGCPECAVRARTDILRTKYSEVVNKAKEACSLQYYKFICFIDGYRNKESKLYYECPVHGVRIIKYCDLIRGSKCQLCVKHGYKEDQNGYFYIYEWSNGHNNFIKFGITNRNLKSRIREQAKHTEYSESLIYCNLFEDGRIPKTIEDIIKSSGLQLNVISKVDFPDGFTETTYYYNLNKILKIVEDYSNSLSH